MSRQKWLWGAVVVAVLAILAYGVNVGIRGVPADTAELPDLPECGHADSTISDPAFAPYVGQPERHDCQRFVVRDTQTQALKYDSLFAIYVSTNAEQLDVVLGAPAPAVVRSPMQPDIIGGPGGGRQLPAIELAPVDARAIAVAEVDAHQHDYPPLGIKAGRNCLYVWNYLSGGSEVWKARMVGADAAGQCPNRTAGEVEALPGKTLQVARPPVIDPTTNQPFSREHYPGVARWDWDKDNAEQYVSIVCGGAWCQIGDDNFSPSAPLSASHATTTEEARVLLIRGWYDQQYLATTDASGKLVPSDVLGTIIPDPGLGKWKKNDNGEAEDGNGRRLNDWTTAAVVLVETSTTAGNAVVDKYVKKLGFHKASLDVPLRLQHKWKGGDTWESRVQHKGFLGLWWSKNNRTKYRSSGTGVDLPGTARWRWKEKDEGTWTRCTQGCCEMSD